MMSRGIPLKEATMLLTKGFLFSKLKVEENTKKVIPGSNAFVPSVMGLIIASEVIKDLIEYKR